MMMEIVMMMMMMIRHYDDDDDRDRDMLRINRSSRDTVPTLNTTYCKSTECNYARAAAAAVGYLVSKSIAKARLHSQDSTA